MSAGHTILLRQSIAIFKLFFKISFTLVEEINVSYVISAHRLEHFLELNAQLLYVVHQNARLQPRTYNTRVTHPHAYVQ